VSVLAYLSLLQVKEETPETVFKVEDESDSAPAVAAVATRNVEYVSEKLEADDSALQAFSDVFARFSIPPEESKVSI
jgi:splicing factor 3B subunit 2